MYGLFSTGFAAFTSDKEMIAKALAPRLSTLTSTDEILIVIDELAALYGWSFSESDYEEIFMMAQMY